MLLHKTNALLENNRSSHFEDNAEQTDRKIKLLKHVFFNKSITYIFSYAFSKINQFDITTYYQFSVIYINRYVHINTYFRITIWLNYQHVGESLLFTCLIN